MKKSLFLSAMLVGCWASVVRADPYYVDITVIHYNADSATVTPSQWPTMTYEFNGSLPTHDLLTGACYSDVDITLAFVSVRDMSGNYVGYTDGPCYAGMY